MVFFNYRDYDNTNRVDPGSPGGNTYEVFPDGNASNKEMEKYEIAPISNGLFILSICCLVYLLIRKKKIFSVLLLASPLVFTQCNHNNEGTEEDDNEIKSIYVEGYAYASANGSRSNIALDDKGNGVINWDDNETIYCYAVNTHNIFTPFINSSSNPDEFSGYATSYISGYLRFYKIGESKVDVIDGNTNPMGGVIPTQTNISLDFSEQSGRIEDFGKYHISKSDDVKIIIKPRPAGQMGTPAQTFEPTATFTSMIAYACFDLSKYEGKEVVLSVDDENFHNHFLLKGEEDGINSNPDEIFSQVEGSNGEITITSPSSETYVVLAPLDSDSESPVINFSVDGVKVGSVTFPSDGILANRLYTGRNGSPIKLGSKAVIY